MKIWNTAIALAVLAALLSGCATAAGGLPVASAPSDAATAALAAAASAENADYGDGTEIVFTDTDITASAAQGLEIDGTALTITAGGTYILSGQCTDGSVKVQKSTVGVTLVLQGLTLTSETTAPILCSKGTEVTIVAAAGTENTLADTENNNAETGNADAENAVIKCKDGSNVTLCGTGTLNIRANGKNGIKSGASTQEEGDASLTVQSLTLNIDAPKNDAVNAEAALNVESGTLTLSAGDDALHCDYTLNIGGENTPGPCITVSACYEGLEGATVHIYSGDVNIMAVDDCINAANGDLTDYAYALNISGGTVVAFTTTGDGFDSNGDLTISGGTVAVWSANTADNSPLDADGTVTVSGGTVLAAGGSSGMGMNLSARQPCVIFGGSTGDGARNAAGLLSDGSTFSVLNAQGDTLYSGTSKCAASFLLFSSAELAEGDSCTLSCGSSEAAASAQTGTVSTGMGGGFSGPGRGQPGDRQPGETFGGQKPDGAPAGQPDAREKAQAPQK